MSADFGIVILETKGPEYRVALVKTPDKMYGEFNDNTSRYEPNADFLHLMFDVSEVWTSRNDAFKAAGDLDKELGIHLEYGIFHIDIWRHIEYPNL